MKLPYIITKQLYVILNLKEYTKYIYEFCWIRILNEKKGDEFLNARLLTCYFLCYRYVFKFIESCQFAQHEWFLMVCL